jgi:hypothetical protein
MNKPILLFITLSLLPGAKAKSQEWVGLDFNWQDCD